jgi:DNA-binding transcriptional LysR family regulator
MDPISFDQIRVFLAIVDEGSFSAAAKALRRAQSAVSYAILHLEDQLGVKLFQRSNQRPVLTEPGRALLGEMRKVALDIDALKARAQGLARGLEAELGLVVDVMFPTVRLVELLGEFRQAFPSVPIRLHVEALGAVAQLVRDGVCALGVAGTMPDLPEGLLGEALAPVDLVALAAPTHPLAAEPGRVPIRRLREEVQLVLTDRSKLTEGRDFGVWSLSTWRVGDLGVKHEMLRAGLGWGLMPLHMVEADLAQRRLVRLWPADWAADAVALPLQLLRRADAAPGPAAAWMIERLIAGCRAAAAQRVAPARPRRRAAGR